MQHHGFVNFKTSDSLSKLKLLAILIQHENCNKRHNILSEINLRCNRQPKQPIFNNNWKKNIILVPSPATTLIILAMIYNPYLSTYIIKDFFNNKIPKLCINLNTISCKVLIVHIQVYSTETPEKCC